jgi:hypothetical protein
MTMKLIQCPQNADLTTAEHPIVFLAGGISSCPVWQDEVIKLLLEDASLEGTIINPRRDDFDTNDPEATLAQITWEYRGLQASDIVAFWFPKATDCPITLLELGKCLVRGSHGEIALTIGIEPGYRRAQDVLIQTSLAFEGVEYRPADRLEDHAKRIAANIHELLEMEEESQEEMYLDAQAEARREIEDEEVRQEIESDERAEMQREIENEENAPDDDEDPEMPWESAYKCAIDRLLAEAEWKPEEKKVVLKVEDPRLKGPDLAVDVTSYTELEEMVEEAASTAWCAEAPFDRGEAVFEWDPDLASQYLQEHWEVELTKMGWL